MLSTSASASAAVGKPWPGPDGACGLSLWAPADSDEALGRDRSPDGEQAPLAACRVYRSVDVLRDRKGPW
ncbi:MAG: hypothetical protein OXC82_05185 [Rhodobacteraceae bacterium]|nr:hypothetical protein [Paracoccaceae bacterium]MCY4249816.1 hypothetical protein [Paracoccaceae bacterium]